MGSYHKPSIVTIGTEAQWLADLVRESKDHTGPRLMIPDAMCRLLTALVGHDDNLAAAAAPDLLEALQQMVAETKGLSKGRKMGVEAIAKALPPKETEDR